MTDRLIHEYTNFRWGNCFALNADSVIIFPSAVDISESVAMKKDSNSN